MKTEDHYFRFVRWSEEDSFYVGYCPDLFFGGVCHSKDESEAYQILVELVREEVGDLTTAGSKLPLPMTRPMRELEPAEAVAT